MAQLRSDLNKDVTLSGEIPSCSHIDSKPSGPIFSSPLANTENKASMRSLRTDFLIVEETEESFPLVCCRESKFKEILPQPYLTLLRSVKQGQGLALAQGLAQEMGQGQVQETGPQEQAEDEEGQFLAS